MMKSFLFTLLCLFASASAFAPAHTKATTSALNIVPLKRPDIDYAFEDGLTDLERKQRATLPAFLTGSAKSNIDKTAIRDDFDDMTYEFPPILSFWGSVAGTAILIFVASTSLDPTTFVH